MMIDTESGIAGSRYEEGKSPLRFSGLTLKNMNVWLLSGIDYITHTLHSMVTLNFNVSPV